MKGFTLVINCRLTGNKRVIPFTISEADIEATEKSLDFQFEFVDMARKAAAVGKVVRGEVVEEWELGTSNWAIYVDEKPLVIHHEALDFGKGNDSEEPN